MITTNFNLVIKNDAILKVDHLNAGYGKRQVLFDVSFEAQYDEITLLIGGNGSGKSTLLKAIYGLIPKWKMPKESANTNTLVQFMSENITNTEPCSMRRKELVYVPQKNNSFDQMTVSENLEIASAHIKDKSEQQKRIKNIYEKFPELAILKNRSPFHLSGGERQLLALGMALMPQPKMIMLDEPGAGLSPTAWNKNFNIIRNLNKQGIAFLIVEHRVKEIINDVHRVLQMRLGKFVTS